MLPCLCCWQLLPCLGIFGRKAVLGVSWMLHKDVIFEQATATGAAAKQQQRESWVGGHWPMKREGEKELVSACHFTAAGPYSCTCIGK